MASVLALLAGTLYGLIIGILPGAGATTGLIFVFSFITIKFFLNYIKNFNLNVFVIYRIILGIFLLIIAYL